MKRNIYLFCLFSLVLATGIGHKEFEYIDSEVTINDFIEYINSNGLAQELRNIAEMFGQDIAISSCEVMVENKYIIFCGEYVRIYLFIKNK